MIVLIHALHYFYKFADDFRIASDRTSIWHHNKAGDVACGPAGRMLVLDTLLYLPFHDCMQPEPDTRAAGAEPARRSLVHSD